MWYEVRNQESGSWYATFASRIDAQHWVTSQRENASALKFDIISTDQHLEHSSTKSGEDTKRQKSTDQHLEHSSTKSGEIPPALFVYLCSQIQQLEFKVRQLQEASKEIPESIEPHPIPNPHRERSEIADALHALAEIINRKEFT